MLNSDTLEIFWNKVNKKTDKECWEWTAAKSNGYGRFSVNGKALLSHRISWIIYYGNVPDGMFVCHHCDNPSCVNPNHLFIGTHSDNMRDAYNKGRLFIPVEHGLQFKAGNIPSNRVLSKEEVIILKHLMLNTCGYGIREIARIYGYPYYLLADIRRSRSYKYVGE